MKKAIGILISLSLLLGCNSIAEEFDLNSMSLDQLIALDLSVREKIYEMNALSEGVFYPGQYKASVDIEPGEYILQCVSLMPDRSFVSASKLDTDGDEVELELIDPGESYRMRLSDGETLVIGNGIVIFLKK